MCKHKWIKINDVDVCTRCGLTVSDGKILIIDRKLLEKRGKKA